VSGNKQVSYMTVQLTKAVVVRLNVFLNMTTWCLAKTCWWMGETCLLYLLRNIFILLPG